MYTVSLRFYRIPRLVDGLARKDTSSNGSKTPNTNLGRYWSAVQDTGYGAPYAYLGALPMVFGAKFLEPSFSSLWMYGKDRTTILNWLCLVPTDLANKTMQKNESFGNVWKKNLGSV